MEVPKKTKNRAPCDLALLLLGIYPEKMKTLIQKDTCTLMFIAVLFITAKKWKQPKWLKKMWSMYTIEYYSAIRKNEILPFAATWMDLESIIPSEVRQRKTNII